MEALLQELAGSHWWTSLDPAGAGMAAMGQGGGKLRVVVESTFVASHSGHMRTPRTMEVFFLGEHKE